MILIRNTQRKIKVNIEQLKQDIQTILDHLDYPDFDVGLMLTTNFMIRRYNYEYRHKDKPTDILSFPCHTRLKAGQRIKVVDDWDKNLGDMIISLEYVAKDAKKYDTTFESHLKTLLVHGICHLLGYDHITDKEYKQMHKKETELLKILTQ